MTREAGVGWWRGRAGGVAVGDGAPHLRLDLFTTDTPTAAALLMLLAVVMGGGRSATPRPTLPPPSFFLHVMMQRVRACRPPHWQTLP